MHQNGSIIIGLIPLAIVVVLVMFGMTYLRRQGNSGLRVIVRCQQGHLFSTIWIPLVSFKAVRLGLARFQRCPIGQHWTLVYPVDQSTLSDEERASASQSRDSDVP